MSDASYRAGVSVVLKAADEAAAAIRARPDAGGIRQQAATEALQAFAASFRSEALPEPRNAVLEAPRAISSEPGNEGEIPCTGCEPECELRPCMMGLMNGEASALAEVESRNWRLALVTHPLSAI